MTKICIVFTCCDNDFSWLLENSFWLFIGYWGRKDSTRHLNVSHRKWLKWHSENMPVCICFLRESFSQCLVITVCSQSTFWVLEVESDQVRLSLRTHFTVTRFTSPSCWQMHFWRQNVIILQVMPGLLWEKQLSLLGRHLDGDTGVKVGELRAWCARNKLYT